MSQYLLQVSYTPEAWSALVREPQDRSKVIDAVIRNLGGSMDRVWFSFGEHDLISIIEMPDGVSAAAFSMAISAGGACRKVQTTPLLTAQEGIEAMKKAATCGYTPVTQKTKVAAG